MDMSLWVVQPIRVIGLEQGQAVERQAGLAVDGSRHVVNEARLVTTSLTPIQDGDLDISRQCLAKMWLGACNPRPPEEPAPPAPAPGT